ncbi:hypothetical protein GWK47_050436 [Chionoecetes opilio]|uniref:Uncharacterized protein n=1 Tax=Chionoecetes opilio TaxID=41210 RepID=A0A8J4Y2V5_CHIOP|nr:hypothetical protein GWK47_050436 [Chionoecetes opilio]
MWQDEVSNTRSSWSPSPLTVVRMHQFSPHWSKVVLVLIFAESLEVLVMALEALHEQAKPLGLEVSWLKTKVPEEEEEERKLIEEEERKLIEEEEEERKLIEEEERKLIEEEERKLIEEEERKLIEEDEEKKLIEEEEERKEETANVIDATNRQLGDITAWGRRWQVKFAAEKTQAMVISRSREDPRLLERKLKFGDDTLAIKNSINILGVDVDSRLRFDRHLETVARRASLRVTLLRRARHLLDADGLMRLYKTSSEARHGVQSSHLDELCPVPPVTAGQSVEAC